MKCAFCYAEATSPNPRTCWIHWQDVAFHGRKLPRNRTKPRLSIVPLQERIEQLHFRGMSDEDIAAMCGVNRREIQRLKHGKTGDLTWLRADTWACRFKCHPTEFWPEWTAA